MDGLDPGRVTPRDMGARVTDEVNSTTAAHGAESAAAYDAIDRLLRARLYRVDCPSTHALGELALGMLGREDARELRQHLAACPHCAAELVMIQEALYADAARDALPTPGCLSRVMARLLPLPHTGGAYAAARGESVSPACAYEAAGITLALSVEAGGLADAPGSESAQCWTLLGSLSDASQSMAAAVSAVNAVSLLRAGQLIAAATPDEWGNVSFPELESGRYTVELALDDRVIVVQDVAVGAERCR